RWHFVALTRVFRVARHTHNLNIARFSRVETEIFPNGILIWEKLSRKGLIYDCNARCVRVVMWRQRPSGDERCPHRSEKILAHVMHIDISTRLVTAIRSGLCSGQEYRAARG